HQNSSDRSAHELVVTLRDATCAGIRCGVWDFAAGGRRRLRDHPRSDYRVPRLKVSRRVAAASPMVASWATSHAVLPPAATQPLEACPPRTSTSKAGKVPVSLT